VPTAGVVQPLNKEDAPSDQPSLSWIDSVMTNRTVQEVRDQALDQDDEVEMEAGNECT
jgi:hypothetical protein